MIVMDRENIWGRGWSHVLSTTNDVDELRAFCSRVGAPAAALQLDNRRWPHLDLKLLPRQLALACPDVRVFERTSDMLRFLKALPVALSSKGATGPSPDQGSMDVQAHPRPIAKLTM
jgi:hypothetical protein